MNLIFPGNNKHSQPTVTAAVLGNLEEELTQIAKTRGAAAGLHGIEEDFEASVEPLLHGIFVKVYGDLGPEPAILAERREALEEELDYTRKKLYEHQYIRSATIDQPQQGPQVRYQLYLGLVLTCGLIGLGCETLGGEMTWRSWTMLGVCAALMSLVLQSFPSWVRRVRYAIEHQTMHRRARQLERRILQLRNAEWQAIELRGKRDQFIAPRKNLLGSIFLYYRAAGQCMAQLKNTQRLAAA